MVTASAAPSSGHEPVLLAEVVAALRPHAGGCYLDGTFGGGGHARAILDASAPDGIVLALDADPAAIARGEALSAAGNYDGRLRLRHGNFADLRRYAEERELPPLDGILLDLGLSSFQLDAPERGFAFRFNGPLDMRFDPTSGRSAAEIVNTLPVAELAEIIWRYGEEPRSRRIAAAIVSARRERPLDSTAQLAALVERAAGGRRGGDTHPATRTFQALRIAVNDELAVLERALLDAVDLLRPSGRLAVIAFHSLEDRIVKHFMRWESVDCVCPPDQPVCTCDHLPRVRLVGKATKPDSAEVRRNPRSRSAVLRVAERLEPEAVTKRARRE